MSDRTIFEVCLDSAESAVAAAEGGADRVELCDNLMEGGTTPSAGMIAVTRAAIDIGLAVMIRPRGGDFLCSRLELDAMERDIDVAKERGADAVVFGVLRPDGVVDAEVTAALTERARPMEVTFHRAFDMTRDPNEALEALIGLGVDRVLTSGQENSALEGLDLLTDLVKAAGDRITVMPGVGITPRNVSRILAATRAREIHITGPGSAESGMRFRNPRCFMGTELRSPEYSRVVTAADAVRSIVGRVRT
jgi:copper homeostasis protein